MMGLSLSIPVAMVSFLIGITPKNNFSHLLFTIALIYVIFEIGKTFITLPPSKIEYFK